MIQVGPYRYSPTDAVRTLNQARILWWLWTDEDQARCEWAGRQLRDALAALLDVPAPAGGLLDQLDALGVEAARLVETEPARAAEALELLWPGLRSARDTRVEAGHLAARGEGQAVGLFASGGGVPKHPIPNAEVGWRGVLGDVQRTRVHHGRPWQALCLWSGEVIDALAADGHPIAPGRAGENVTIRDLAWSDVRPGVVLRLGDERDGVVAEVSAYALPCAKNRAWFHDGDVEHMHHERGPVSRVYATVLRPGRLTLGAPVTLLDPRAHP